MVQTHIQKWGNSLGIRIPKQFAKKLQLYVGSYVVLEIENERIIIQSPKYNLDSMLKEVSKKNLHTLAQESEQRGGEAW